MIGIKMIILEIDQSRNSHISFILRSEQNTERAYKVWD